MKDTGREHAGIAFVVVYSPPSSTQVITMHINVDFGVAESNEAVMARCTDPDQFQTSLVCKWRTTIAAPQPRSLASCWDPVPSWSLSCYTILSIIEGRVSGTRLCEHTL